jgi:hypothetical protein
MMRTAWFGAALLSAVLVGAPGCGGNGDTVDDAPPPEMTDDESGDALTDTMGEDAADGGMDDGGDMGDGSMDGTAGGTIEVMAKAGEDGTIEVHSDGAMVGTVGADGAVSEDLAAWMQAQAEASGDAQVAIMVPVALKFDEVGMPLMKAAFAAGFPPTQVSYKPVTE